MRLCFVTTHPATTPNMIWERKNQRQSMRSSRIGLTTFRTEYKSPVHKMGAIKPPSRMGRLGNIGSNAPYSKPTSRDVVTWITLAAATACQWKAAMYSEVGLG